MELERALNRSRKHKSAINERLQYDVTKINFSRNLAELIQSDNVSVKDMADDLNVSNKTLYGWKNGTATPDLDMLIAIADYFGITLDELCR